MAACGANVDEVKGNDIEISASLPSEKLAFPKKTILQVRILEAVGLRRVTNFNLKRVTIRDVFCNLQLRNVTGKTTTSKLLKTKSVKSTLFPLWDETYNFEIHEDDINSKDSVLRFHVQGSDRISPGDLGQVDIRIYDIARNCVEGSFQRWYQLEKRIPPKTNVAGKIFVSFQIVEKGKQGKNKPPVRAMETKEEEVGIYIGSMNCGNAAPPDNLQDWLHPDIEEHKIVVVGCQECDWKKEKNEEEIWQDAILQAINDAGVGNNAYVPLMAHSLTEMRVYIFIDQRSVENQKVCHVSCFQEATGLGSVYGNKGGVLISLDYGGTSFCFINSHLAAHQKDEFWKRRDSDYKEICGNINGVGNIKQDIMEQFHHVFWLGDLNYRCNYKQMDDPKDTPKKELFDEYTMMVAKQKYSEMQEFDQLNLSRKNGRAFFGFREEKIDFPPTFKVYKDRPYEYQPKRAPSWCDRILWKSAPGFEGGVKCNRYLNAPKIQSSDHKPVYGEFSVLTWPRASGTVDRVMKATISFKNMRASGLRQSDIASASDPYLHFPRQELLAVYQKSKKVKNTHEPEWPDDQVPRLNLQRTNPEFLSNALLLVQCRDYDRFSAPDKLASGCLSIKPLVEAPGTWVAFKHIMTYEGVADAGVLEGEFRLDLLEA